MPNTTSRPTLVGLLVAGAALAIPASTHAQADAAPRPDQASGIAQPEPTPAGDQLRWVPRAALFVPTLAFWVAVQPVRLTAWAYDRYHLGERYHRGLIVIGDRFGVVPVVSSGGGFGLGGGVRGFDRDLFGAGEHLVLSASFGGEYQQAYGIAIDSGRRLGPIELGVAVDYERRPHDRFTGIGNADLAETRPEPGMLIDPSTDSTAVATRFRQDVVRVKATATAALTRELGVTISGAYVRRDLDPTGGATSIDTAYDTTRLAGFATGVETVYVETELAYDSRRPTSPYQSQAIDATGWLAAAHAGAAFGIGDDTTEYQRYGLELQRYFDLYRGSRVLALRAMVDGVLGTDGRSDGRIAFTDLPRLGGLRDLRGYSTDRFRDRTVALASAEYTWVLGNGVAAFGFVDAGRTADAIEDLRVSDLHIGYGGGLQLASRTSFVARAQVSATPDGDLGFQLALTPAFSRRERTGRK